MTDLIFKPIEEEDLDLLASWFVDPDTRRWVEPPTPQWFRYIHAGLENHAWILYDAGRPVGLVQLDIAADHTGYFAMVTNPAFRQRGYGRRMLQALIKMQHPGAMQRIVGTVEPENIGSIRCMLSPGFLQDSAQPDAEGFLRFSYPLERRSKPRF